ncbi:MAG: hypothetical protein IT236_16010, partial [Bacteroidia bacterium]|nr:hypothetical protein [Bacteroidia bacterium]
YGPRGWQDEYCEWAVTRVNDKITSVMFTCENPEYWFLLWNTDPNVVLKLYKQAFGISNIQLDDLCLYSEDGKKVIDPETGRPAYNPINKWNNGTATNFTDPSNPSGGAMHLTSPPNSLGAEVYLAAAATIQRYNGTKHITAADKLICCSQYGQPNRNSDPHIGQSVNLTIYNQGSTAIQATLLNPVGLYLQLPDSTAFNTVFSFPAKNNAPAGKTPMDCWKVTRGQANCPGYPNNAILHLVFEVPAEWGFTVGDMTMNYTSAQGEGYSGPVLYGAQLVELLQVQLCAVGIAATTPIQNLPCVASTTAANTLPSTNYLMDAGIYFASVNQYNQLNKFANLTPQILSVQRGTTRSNIVLQTNDADDTASISFGAGVQVTINSYTAATSVFLITIEVDKTAATGERDLTISMPGKPGIAAPCYLNITA